MPSPSLNCQNTQPLVWGYFRPVGVPMTEARAMPADVESESKVWPRHVTRPSASKRPVRWCPL